MNEDLLAPEVLRRQLEWRCRRGTRELDFFMEGWLHRCYDHASQADQAAFRRLVLMPDPDLYDLLIGVGRHDDDDINRIADAVRTAAYRA